MHPCPHNWVANGHAVMYYARAAHASSARIKHHHCSSLRPKIQEGITISLICLIFESKFGLNIKHRAITSHDSLICKNEISKS